MLCICRTLARYGPRYFGFVNIGVSTVRALWPSAGDLADDWLLAHYNELRTLSQAVVPHMSHQTGGSHAEEIETAMTLQIGLELVDVDKTTQEFHFADLLSGTGAAGQGYSATEIYGDAMPATHAKGDHVVEAMVTGMWQAVEFA